MVDPTSSDSTSFPVGEGSTSSDVLVRPEERERAVDRLSDAFSRGFLSLDDFERRVAQAYKVSTSAALDQLVGDLPEEPTIQAGAGAIHQINSKGYGSHIQIFIFEHLKGGYDFSIG